MKRIVIAAVLGGGLVLGVGGVSKSGRVEGSGQVEMVERGGGPFDGVVVSGGIDLEISQGGRNAVSLQADDNLLPYIRTEVRDGDLRISIEEGIQILQSTRMTARVQVRDLRRVAVSGGGDVLGLNPVHTDHVQFKLSGGGNLRFGLAADRAECLLSGGGNAELEGSVGEIKASLSGGGDLAYAGEVRSMDLLISGGGDARIRGRRGGAEVKANLSGGGNLDMDMPCKAIRTITSGGGNVKIRAGSDLDTATLSLSGGGDLDLTADAEELDVKIRDGGHARLQGSAERMSVSLSGGGTLEAAQLRAETGKLKLDDGSHAQVHVVRNLHVHAGTGAEIRVDGDPHIDAHLKDGAHIVQN